MRAVKFICAFVVLCSSYAFAVTKIDITRSHISPMPIAITEFEGDKKVSNKIRAIIKNNLESTGLFRVIDKEAYIENIGLGSMPTFASWRQINATTVTGGVISKKGRRISAEYKMWDVFSQKEISSSKFKSQISDLRRLAHKISDDIYKKLTGEEGYFNTKITYIALKKNRDGRVSRRLAVMDQDGYNNRYLTDGKNLVLTSRFSPSAGSILYLSYEPKQQPRVRSINVKTKFSRLLGEFKGMSYAPRYVDNKYVLLSRVKEGVSNIYMLDMDDMEQKQLTYCSSICTSPSSSPDKKQIVFNSDMGGTRQLYVMDNDGKHVERISFNSGYYSSPLWSPRGDLIAFTKMLPGKGFYIGVMKPDGSGERLITKGWLVDGASWAPNGRVLMFEKENGPNKGKGIYTVDITGNNIRRLKTPGEASDPSWSNNLG